MGVLTSAERARVAKPLLWIGMTSMFMAFAGLISGYIVSRSSLIAANSWLEFPLPENFTYSTVVIVVSSITITLATILIKKNNVAVATLLIWLTFCLGVAFAVLQYLGWQTLIENKIYFTGSNTAGSWVYAITGFHLAHLLGGLVSMFVTGIKALTGKYSDKNSLGIQQAATFWHFLDLLWVLLFLFLVFIR